MYLRINGLDIMPYIEQKGIKWTRNDLDGANAGRTMDGLMHRERITSKVRLDITCLPLSSEDAKILLTAIYPEHVEVEYIDPMYGPSIKTMYTNNSLATYIDTKADLWEGITFPLVER